jgi:hypothetical protein
MYASIIAAISTVATLQGGITSGSIAVTQPPAPAESRVDARTASSLPRTVATRPTSAPSATPVRSLDDHLDSAQRAMAAGEFDLARREYSAAAALDRAAGKLPVMAMTGLANALYAQAYNREAAMTMERLANEARLRGDADAEAIALADAIWLNIDAGQQSTARLLSKRLKDLTRDNPLSADALKMLRARLG